MSRYNLQGNDPNHHVVVGWDNPLQTFFAQVIDITRDEDDDMLVWEGCDPRKRIESVDDLQKLLKDYASIPLNIRSLLEKDKDQATPPSPLQQKVARIFEGFLNEKEAT